MIAHKSETSQIKDVIATECDSPISTLFNYLVSLSLALVYLL